MGTVIAILAVAALAGVAVRSLIKSKKAGKKISCGGDCSKCSGCP